jgi:mannose/cellobiose epimerase-like protein (N-acyl-D-glucosamine 2-epimerase family)
MSIDQVQDRARTWLFDVAAPFWLGTGVHADGMFVEAFTREGQPIDQFRRLRVQARQIYSACEIGRLGYSGPWRQVVAAAVDHLVGKGINEHRRFSHMFDSNAEICDTRPDLYDQAFGLFALAHAGEALDRPDLHAKALMVLDTLEGDWTRPEGGFWEGEITPCPPYRQNPHMHMLEASLAHYAFTGNDRWKHQAVRISELFKTRFQHASSGAVTEYFDQDWRPLPGTEGQIVEPGHCLEWAWLFDVACDPVRDVAVSEQLSGFARKFGLCADRGVAINEVSATGEIIDARARLWPQTERLKSAVSRYRRTGAAEDEAEIVAAYTGLERYFDPSVPGIWWDKLDEQGRPLDEPAPASSLYHIVCGLSELLRL